MENVKELDQDFAKVVVDWFVENKRDLPWRKDREPYNIWISEIMLQQTRVEAVREYYERWMRKLPTIEALASASEEELLKLWQGLGYYNRVRNIQKAAKTIVNDMDGKFPDSYETIHLLSGIGDYTAGAIASNCFDERVAAVDGNVLRVMCRLLEDGEDIGKDTTKKKYASYLKDFYPLKGCGDFTQGLIEIGATICVPNGKPKCDQCPIHAYCKGFYNGTKMNYPVKNPKKQRKIVEMTVFILSHQRSIAIEKRKEAGLLHGLYQYPNVEGNLTADQALRMVEDWNCKPKNLLRQSQYKHIFTHVEWHMTGYYITCDREGAPPNKDYIWVTEQELEKEIPMPSAFMYF